MGFGYRIGITMKTLDAVFILHRSQWSSSLHKGFYLGDVAKQWDGMLRTLTTYRMMDSVARHQMAYFEKWEM